MIATHGLLSRTEKVEQGHRETVDLGGVQAMMAFLRRERPGAHRFDPPFSCDTRISERLEDGGRLAAMDGGV